MLNRKFMAVLSVAMTIPLGGLAVADSGMIGWSDQALVSEARLRAANKRFESDAMPHPVFDYRNLRVMRSEEQSPIVCGEIKERNNPTWAEFDFDPAKDETNLEPHSTISEATADWFGAQCHAAVERALKRTDPRGSDDEIRTCEVFTQLSEARWERMRFKLHHGINCGVP